MVFWPSRLYKLYTCTVMRNHIELKYGITFLSLAGILRLHQTLGFSLSQDGPLLRRQEKSSW